MNLPLGRSAIPLLAALTPIAAISCASAGHQHPTSEPPPIIVQVPESPQVKESVPSDPPKTSPIEVESILSMQGADIFETLILVVPGERNTIPANSRIVIADIEGDCAREVKDALMRRLIDNVDYAVLTRDNLRQIISEADKHWTGRFNTETAAKLGELMGASLWIVGRVTYCGPDLDPVLEDEEEEAFKVSFAIQIIDLSTRKVLISGSSEGRFIPRPIASARFESSDLEEGQEESGAGDGGDGPAAEGSTKEENSKKEAKQRPKGPFTIVQAAENAADEFADKFFARPFWERVEMWRNDRWVFSESLRLVQLGHCSDAVQMLEGRAATQLKLMQEAEVAQYLHNLGVALLCSNDRVQGIDKLRASYRISRNPSTLKMLGLASRLEEWSLQVEEERQPEVDLILFAQAGS